jgi:hypothetical protein
MPNAPRHHQPETGLVPVPAAVLLPTDATSHDGRLPAGRLSVDATCRLVANHTDAGDPVADLNHDQHTNAAVAWLGRQPLVVDTTDPHQPTSNAPARLVIARLPIARVHSLAGITSWMRHVREHLLAPGGYLLTIVVPTIRGGRYLDRSTTVIAAAKAAGLIWQQHLIHIRTALPEPAATETVPDSPRLATERHQRVHDDLFTFAYGGVDA